MSNREIEDMPTMEEYVRARRERHAFLRGQYKAGKLGDEAGKYLFAGVLPAQKQAPKRPVNRRKTGIAALYGRVSPQLDVLLEATGHADPEDREYERQRREDDDR